METHIEYEQLITPYDLAVAEALAIPKRRDDREDRIRDAYRKRWLARLRHESWEQKRADFIWYTNSTCERCGMRQQTKDLQLHHLHYDTLWYENNEDLELLCPGCHRIADEERAAQETRRRSTRELSIEKRARIYMELANKWSGQKDWPVSYTEALERVTEINNEEST